MQYLFSYLVEANDESEAIASFQDQNIDPSDMDIQEIEEEQA